MDLILRTTLFNFSIGSATVLLFGSYPSAFADKMGDPISGYT